MPRNPGRKSKGGQGPPTPMGPPSTNKGRHQKSYVAITPEERERLNQVLRETGVPVAPLSDTLRRMRAAQRERILLEEEEARLEKARIQTLKEGKPKKERPRTRKEIIHEMTPGQKAEYYERSAEGMQKQWEYWLRRKKVDRALPFHEAVRELVTKLPAAQQQKWFERLQRECEARRVDYEKVGDIQNAALFEQLAKKNRESGNPTPKSSPSAPAPASAEPVRRPGVQYVVLNPAPIQEVIIPAAATPLTSAQRGESRALLMGLLKIPGTQFVAVLNQRVRALAAAQTKKSEPKAPARKMRGKVLPVRRTAASQKQPRARSTRATWQEQLRTRFRALHPQHQRELMHLLNLGEVALDYHAQMLRKGNRRLADKCMHAHVTAMQAFWKNLDLRAPSIWR